MTIVHRVEFEPIGRRGQIPDDASLLEAARLFGVDLTGDCGGVGVCGHCRVQVLVGEVTPLSDAEDLELRQADIDAGFRLACMTYPLSDCKIGVPPESLSTPMRTLVDSAATTVALAPFVQGVDLTLPLPSLSHPLADADSLLAELRAKNVAAATIDLAVLRTLSDDLRAWDWQCRAFVRGDEVVAVGPAQQAALGLAVDLGSTGIAGYLVDLESGETLAAQGLMNPQINYGEDIISRINYALKSVANQDKLRQVVVDGLNDLAQDLCQTARVRVDQVVDVVIVGNTAMHHLLLGLPVRQLALAPFVPAIAQEIHLKVRDVGLALAPGAYLHMPLNIAGFVGSDHVAMLLATAELWTGKTAIALDIGTNTEISLLTPDGQIASVSCASGPAFEGYQIKDGTRAKAGAIERVWVDPASVRYETIADAPPLGICGSGILDAVAQMQLAGVLSENGRLQIGSHPRVHSADGQREFLLVEPNDERRPITITQDDVREIQLAKSSIQTGVQMLLAERGIDLHDVEMFIIAGAFGSYIDVPNALAIGMFPSLPLERYVQVGNAAGAGARLALLSHEVRAQAQTLLSHIHYIELARHPRFSRAFARNCSLRPYVG